MNAADSMSEICRVVIKNKRGLHARASAKFVSMAGGFDAEITVSKDGAQVCGTSIMGLLMLAAAPGDEITIKAEGAGYEVALEALQKLVDDKFGED